MFVKLKTAAVISCTITISSLHVLPLYCHCQLC